jgi:sec-independent protein translocase protein TatB
VGLTFEKLLIIMVIAVFVLGPDRLPMYAQKLAQLVKSVKQMASGAKERMRDEMGPEFDEVDWKKLDPRQYDPRRIIRDALVEDESSPEARRARAAKASAERQAKRAARAATDAPANLGPMAFDEEAT